MKAPKHSDRKSYSFIRQCQKKHQNTSKVKVHMHRFSILWSLDNENINFTSYYEISQNNSKAESQGTADTCMNTNESKNCCFLSSTSSFSFFSIFFCFLNIGNLVQHSIYRFFLKNHLFYTWVKIHAWEYMSENTRVRIYAWEYMSHGTTFQV